MTGRPPFGGCEEHPGEPGPPAPPPTPPPHCGLGLSSLSLCPGHGWPRSEGRESLRGPGPCALGWAPLPMGVLGQVGRGVLHPAPPLSHACHSCSDLAKRGSLACGGCGVGKSLAPALSSVTWRVLGSQPLQDRWADARSGWTWHVARWLWPRPLYLWSLGHLFSGPGWGWVGRALSLAESHSALRSCAIWGQ